ncbi:MAG: hypothetical protein RL377_953, partial [Bacteroidota bacterium]
TLLNNIKYIVKTIKSDLLKSTPSIKYYLFILFVCSYMPVLAQQKPSIKNILTKKQKDSSYLVHPLKDAEKKLKTDIVNYMRKRFSNYSNNALYLKGGLNLTNQSVGLGGYHSNFNYDMTNYQQGGYKAGYSAGISIDGTYKGKHLYAFEIGLNSISPGTNYSQLNALKPFLGSFSNFKADNHFYTLNLSAHYKKLIPLGDTSKRKFYWIIGPSIITRLSAQSEDNQVNNNYNRFLLAGDLGLEFDNQSYYTLFIHYKRGLHSFTASPINTTMSSFELGMKIKASDLF